MINFENGVVPINDTNLNKLQTDLLNIINDNEEFTTNRIINGKQEYGKKIDLGTLPNASLKDVSIGIDMKTVTVTKMEGVAYRSTDKSVFPLPLVTVTSVESIQFFVYGNTIRVFTGTDRSNCTGFIIIYYTKN